MNEIEFNKLLNVVTAGNVKSALFYDVNLSIENIKDLHSRIAQIWIVSDQLFFQKAIIARIRSGVNFIKSKQNVRNIKSDLIVCNQANNDALQFHCMLGSKIIYTMKPIDNAPMFVQYGLRLVDRNILSSFSKDALKLHSNSMLKNDGDGDIYLIDNATMQPTHEDESTDNIDRLKIGFGITTTSTRFNILRESLTLLIKLMDECKKSYDFMISVYNDEALTEDKLTEWNQLHELFPNVVFNSCLLKSIAKAKNMSMKPLIEAKCDQYFMLDDDVLIIDRRAIDYYSKACRNFHFLHFHLPNYLPNEETMPKLVKQYNGFKVLQHSYDTGCMIVFDNETIEKCGAWDENFIGWGYEHREFESRASAKLFNRKYAHLSIPEVYKNNYVVSFDVFDRTKLDEYRKLEPFALFSKGIEKSNVSYDRMETNAKNIEYAKKKIAKFNSIFDNQVLKDFFSSLKTKYKLDEKFGGKKKCIIIGANPSIYGYHLKEYINNENAIILRINRYPNKDIIENVGDKTDYIITWSYLSFDKDDPRHDSKFIVFEYELKDNNKNIEYVKNVVKQYYGLSTVWTTGFFAILMSMFYFDEVELFGFGFSDEKSKNVVSYSYNSAKFTGNAYHNFTKEHKIVDSFISDFGEKICRLEEKFINDKAPIEIAMTTDKNYSKMTMMAINDIILARQCGTKLNFHVFFDNVDKSISDQFSVFNNLPLVNVKTYDVSTKSQEVNAIFKKIGKTVCTDGSYINGTAFIRCMLPDLLPDLDKVLYLDQDIYVRSDLSEYFDVRLDETNLIAVVKDFYSNIYQRPEVKKDCPAPLRNKKYFYAGQMLMNLKALRDFSLSEKCLSFLKEKLPYHKEMSALNYYLWDKARFIDCKWCFSYHCILMGNAKYNNIKSYNDLYGTNYANMNALIENSVIWHFHGDKSEQMKTPAIKKLFNAAEERLSNLMKYFN